MKPTCKFEDDLYTPPHPPPPTPLCGPAKWSIPLFQSYNKQPETDFDFYFPPNFWAKTAGFQSFLLSGQGGLPSLPFWWSDQ